MSFGSFCPAPVMSVAARFACPVYRSKIGEANVTAEMVRQHAVVGGEGNGGIIYPRINFARDSLVGGGLNIDVLAGYEFLRASSVHFFGQLELNAPAYILKTESDSGAIDTYMPGMTAQIGVIF